jgi:hypothetical protein
MPCKGLRSVVRQRGRFAPGARRGGGDWRRTCTVPRTFNGTRQPLPMSDAERRGDPPAPWPRLSREALHDYEIFQTVRIRARAPM